MYAIRASCLSSSIEISPLSRRSQRQAPANRELRRSEGDASPLTCVIIEPGLGHRGWTIVTRGSRERGHVLNGMKCLQPGLLQMGFTIMNFV